MGAKSDWATSLASLNHFECLSDEDEAFLEDLERRLSMTEQHARIEHEAAESYGQRSTIWMSKTRRNTSRTPTRADARVGSRRRDFTLF